MLVFHPPVVYNLTLQVDSFHDLEHTLFLGLGLLFWDQVIGPIDVQGRLSLMGRSAMVLAGMVVSWGLAIAIGYAAIRRLLRVPGPVPYCWRRRHRLADPARHRPAGQSADLARRPAESRVSTRLRPV